MPFDWSIQYHAECGRARTRGKCRGINLQSRCRGGRFQNHSRVLIKPSHFGQLFSFLESTGRQEVAEVIYSSTAKGFQPITTLMIDLNDTISTRMACACVATGRCMCPLSNLRQLHRVPIDETMYLLTCSHHTGNVVEFHAQECPSDVPVCVGHRI